MGAVADGPDPLGLCVDVEVIFLNFELIDDAFAGFKLNFVDDLLIAEDDFFYFDWDVGCLLVEFVESPLPFEGEGLCEGQ